MILPAADGHKKHTLTRHGDTFCLGCLCIIEDLTKKKKNTEKQLLRINVWSPKKKKKKDLHLLSFILLNFGNIQKA